ncbi:MAG: glycosyltransferase [Paludibacteraceae bacterium]|nr:glycosyltransferase [Paludibacteraceae bacterium]
MTLSIITINYNNAEGLRKTLASVASQTYPHIEHIIVDGGSTDNSVEVIRKYESSLALSPHRLKWISEKDTGIYNAMNKGLEIALGRRIVNEDHTSCLIASSPHRLIASDHYIQILNSGDILAARDVTERMMAALQNTIKQQHQQHNINNPSVVAQYTTTATENNTSSPNCQTSDSVQASSPHRLIASSPYQNRPTIFYGNMTKVNAAGQIVGKSGYTEYSLRQFYSSTLNHDCAYIRADLFEQYGLYDENLKIVSDWKWYLQAIGLGRVKPEYVDIDVTIFDDGGISETNLALRNKERRQVLEELLPPAVLWDYDTHAFEMEQMKRLRRWKLYPIVYFMERVLFKLEKWGILG